MVFFDFLPQPPWEGPPLPRDRVTSKTSKKKIVLYHGTLKSNVPSILSMGLVPGGVARGEVGESGEKMVKRVVKEYGLDAEELPYEVIEYPVERKMEASKYGTGTVLTPDKDYAWKNARSGLEAEAELRDNLESWLGTGREEYYWGKKMIQVGEVPAALLAVLFLPGELPLRAEEEDEVYVNWIIPPERIKVIKYILPGEESPYDEYSPYEEGEESEYAT